MHTLKPPVIESPHHITSPLYTLVARASLTVRTTEILNWRSAELDTSATFAVGYTHHDVSELLRKLTSDILLSDDDGLINDSSGHLSVRTAIDHNERTGEDQTQAYSRCGPRNVLPTLDVRPLRLLVPRDQFMYNSTEHHAFENSDRRDTDWQTAVLTRNGRKGVFCVVYVHHASVNDLFTIYRPNGGRDSIRFKW